MKARRKGKTILGPAAPTISTAELSKRLRQRTRINIYTAPFKGRQSREVKKFRKALLTFFSAKKASASLRKRAEHLLVEAIRVPIRRRQYGKHSRSWAHEKGFQRRFFDTGQLYMSISARIKKIAGGGKVFGPFQQ
jgi:hypothetical protein